MGHKTDSKSYQGDNASHQRQDDAGLKGLDMCLASRCISDGAEMRSHPNPLCFAEEK